MTSVDVTITSQGRHFKFEVAILNSKPAVIQLTMASPKTILFCSKKHTWSKQAQKVKNYLLLANEGGKPEKRQKQSKYTSEKTVAMETSITIDTSLKQENFL